MYTSPYLLLPRLAPNSLLSPIYSRSRQLRFEHYEVDADHLQIYGHGSKGTPGSVPHKHWLRYGRTINGEPNLIQARDADHNRQRKIFTPAFSDRALKQQEPLFLKYTDQLVSKLKEGIAQDPDAKLDMVRMFNFCTFDIMGDLTFGEPLHMLDNAE
jgi:cytochrome P450